MSFKTFYYKYWKKNVQYILNIHLIGFYNGENLRILLKKNHSFKEIGILDLNNSSKGRSNEFAKVFESVRKMRLPFILRLMPQLAIEVSERLPKVSQADLQMILENRIDILTPWSAEQSFLKLLGTVSDGKGMVRVNAVVVPKHVISDLLFLLERIDFCPDILDVGNYPDCTFPKYNLLNKKFWSLRGLTSSLLLYIISIYFFVLSTSLFFEAKQIQEKFYEKNALAIERSSLISDLQDLQGQAKKLQDLEDYLSARFFEDPPSLLIIKKISQILPDSAFLTSLTIEGKEIFLSGYSQNAATLVPIFENFPLFYDVRLVNLSERLLAHGENDSSIEMESFSLRLKF